MDTIMLSNGVVIDVVSVTPQTVEMDGTYVSGVVIVTSGVSLEDVKEYFSTSSNLTSFTYVSEDKVLSRTYSGYQKLKSIGVDAEHLSGDDAEYIVTLAQTSDVKELIEAWKNELELHSENITNLRTELLENEETVATKFDEVQQAVSINVATVKEHDELIKSVNETVATLVPTEYVPSTLEEAKTLKIEDSKLALATYLSEHPIISTCHDSETGLGQYYSVTAEKQQYLTSMISIATLATQQGIEYQCSWNAVGEPCTYDWTLEQLQQLALEIAEYVRPLVSQQQTYEASINAMTDIDEVMASTFVCKS